MKDIELLAKGLFDRFCLKKEGKTFNWNYLSKERQIEWAKEVVIILQFMVSEIRSKMKPIPPPSKGEASYGLGFINGMQSKQMEFIGYLEYLDSDLRAQLNEFINPRED